MVQATFVFFYLAVVIYIGVFAFRKSSANAEDFFVAGRSLGPYVFLLSLFGTNMTAFTILGSSGHAFANGIVTFGLMASSSAVVIPLTLYLCGTRVWALGKRFGFMTPVQMFRDRWECGHIGSVISIVQSALLVPYIIIGVMGGGTTLEAISLGAIPYWFGGGLVAIVVMIYVFFGGMRGTAWVNTLQTILFLSFGAAAVFVIGSGMGGFSESISKLANSPATKALLTREKVSPLFFLSYMFIPLSSIAFPHISIFCLTAAKMSQFKKTVILYPLCILAIWAPCVFLGVAANAHDEIPAVREKQSARAFLPKIPQKPPAALFDEYEYVRNQVRAKASADDIVIVLLNEYAPFWLAGLLGAGIMAAVMASDSQILALSTLFTEDLFAFYGAKRRFGEAAQVNMGRAFVVVVTIFAYWVALNAPQSIFDIAVQYAFSGYAALSPLLLAALFWRGSTKWGALAATLWTVAAVAAQAIFQSVVAAPAGPPVVAWRLGSLDVLTRTPGGTAVLGLMPVMPMVIGSALLMWIVSMLTPKPGPVTLARYFRS